MALALALPGLAAAQADLAPAEAFAALEAAGARIGEIRVSAEDIFDTRDPREDNALFRTANRLHIRTRPDVIRRQLLFRSGDPVSVRLIEESERLLRTNRYLHDVSIRPVPAGEGVVDIEVVTRDTWSLDLGTRASRTGGANSTGLSIADYNLLGTGTAILLGRSRDVDRTSTTISYRNQRAFGTWTDFGLEHSSNSDGRRDALNVVRPFYALDTRWSAGLTASRDDRLESVYRGGAVASQYRRQTKQAEVFGGRSTGLVDGWVNRLSAGVTMQDAEYAAEPGRTAPAALPSDRRLRAPFVRWEVVQDRFDRELNRNLIGRPEFFALGLASTVQIGQTFGALGSSESALLYAATVGRGFKIADDQTLIGTASIAGQYFQGEARRHRVGAQLQYYVPQGPHWLFYASAAGDGLTRPDPAEALLLGGEEGLRGYPLRYQAGTRRALFTVEERFYTDLYPWRLFRIGGAVFADAGRAWGGDLAAGTNTGVLADIGAGLRIVSSRSAFSNVLHIDLAMPLNRTAELKKFQFLVKTKASF